MDTQWPRYEVFKQDAPDQPHQSVGSVHAPDGEMALLNARDVYGRRPSCYQLWVAPESAILEVTAEEMQSEKVQQALQEAQTNPPSGSLKTWLVFQKLSQKRSMTYVNHVGEVEAGSAYHALTLALEKFPQPEVWVWWICPASAITASEPEVVESWFAPANDKIYRQQSHYGNVKRKRLEEREQIAQQLSQPKTEVTP